MKKNTKEDIQVWTAVGMLFAGVGLSVAGFVVEPLGQIHDSVLWFFAQCLIYAGSIFGIGIYVNGKFNSLVDRLNNKEQRMMSWIRESNRMKHLLYAIPAGVLLTILFVAGLAAGMEFKDRAYGNKWDWLDIATTLIGGVIGQVIQVVVLILIL